MDASKIHTEEEFYNKFSSIVIQGVSSTLEQKLSDLVKFINRFTPSITIASDPMNSVEVNLKVNPVKESPENILQLPERIAEAKGIKIIVCIDEFQQLANLQKWKNLEAMLRAVAAPYHLLSLRQQDAHDERYFQQGEQSFL